MDREPTPTSVETVAAVAGAGISQLTSSSAADEGRFLPGALLAGRYRILGLLGRGGMGEVYRATDLALGQAVALKFLPEEASRNPRLLERFHGEVRVARLVSHPNVCRVFDIGEAEGAPFLSMEYVDGEDLACLLTRIGRLPGDKAVQAARQICAGLAAAHDRGVIHRDLKPQNIMMNKRGDVVIMDFGLAAIADQLGGAEARNGTPAYMAPEQLRGAGVTPASDIYALGLVLYELFTGKRPYEAGSVQQLMDLQQSANLTSVTSVAPDVDPAVEKVIRRCLDPEPARRPPTALAVAAALPGGDPLAAALAAGETPSPELVANAGKVEGLPRKYSIPALAVIVASLAITPWFYARNRAAMRAPLESSPDVLAHASREIAASFGFSGRPGDSAVWLEHRADLVNYLGKLPGAKSWEQWFATEAPIRAVYRESPEPMVALSPGGISRHNPPATVPGMTTVTVDGHGRLLAFSGVPQRRSPPAAATPEAIFRAARLDMTAFREIAPTMVPDHASDALRAWEGPHPDLPDTRLTVQAAFWRGQITQALVIYPWMNQEDGDGPANPVLAQGREMAVFLLPLVGTVFAVLVARRNWKLGRIDRKGALRVAAARSVLSLVVWAGMIHPAPTTDMLGLFWDAGGDALMRGALLWLVYLAIEPAVRARYPHSMITWNRLLAGRILDARVAGDVLIGGALGSLLWVIFAGLEMSSRDAVTTGGNNFITLGARQFLARHASIASEALAYGLLVFAVICFMRRLVRYDALAAVLTAIVFTMREGDVVNAANVAVTATLFVTVYAVLAFALMRIGLVATIGALYFINTFSGIWLGGGWTAWYTPTGIAALLVALAVALFAFWRSLGSRDLLGAQEG